MIRGSRIRGVFADVTSCSITGDLECFWSPGPWQTTVHLLEAAARHFVVGRAAEKGADASLHILDSAVFVHVVSLYTKLCPADIREALQC